MGNKDIRLAGIAYESLVNGPEIRRVIFAQGCKHNCLGCFNPETHDFLGGEVFDMDFLLEDIKSNPILAGVTFSGGDPWEQGDKFAYLAREIKGYGLNIWCYTGYTFEYILQHKNERKGWREMLEYIDVLIDGRFEESKKEDGLKFRGSSNQRIIDLGESLRKGEVVVLDF
jgi:anaerobic ribonucleoside-triphosphate reductase activating protein